MISTIIVDDEKPALIKMTHLLSDYPDYQVLGAYTSVTELLNALPKLQPQVAFLDIAMPGMTGIELAQHLKTQYKDQIKIVFVTAYDEYAVSAFDLYAVDYLLKPIKKERFQQTIQRLNNLLSPEADIRLSTVLNSPPLMIRAFGKLEISGSNDPQLTWRTAKVRELFALFLHHYPDSLFKNTLLDSLWEGLTDEKALANLNTCNYYLRKSLEQLHVPISLLHEKGYYRLDLGGIPCDAHLFSDAEVTAKSIDEHNVDFILYALSLYRGKYLEDVKCTWANLIRDQYDIRYAKLRVKLAGYYKQSGDTEHSTAQLIKALDTDPLSDEAWDLLLDNYQTQNDQVRYKKTLDNRALIYKQYSI